MARQLSNVLVARGKTTHDKGQEGELTASRYLERKGYGILQRNFRIRQGEVDIIAVRDKCLVFCEVKAWKTLPLESLEYALSERKRRRIIQTATLFLLRNRRYDDYRIRFDVIHIETGAEGRIRHLESAFDGEKQW